MAERISRGEVWMYQFQKPDKRRPVLVLSRQDAIRVIRTVMVAPITSTRRGLPSEVFLDERDGMKNACAVNLDHVNTVSQSGLRTYVTTLPPERMRQVCRALGIATGCL